MPKVSRGAQRPDAVATDLLIPEESRADFDIAVRALLARNKALEVAEAVRAGEELTKREVAARASMDPSVVRRLLTAENANPTAENLFRVMGALGIRLEAIGPDGERTVLL